MAKFHSDRYNLKNYLDELKAIIPDYQRGYSWEQDQVGEFLEDLHDESERPNESEYFFGPIVVIDSDDGSRKQIIDGQQRLTTVTIFLAVCRDLLSAVSKGFRDENTLRVFSIMSNYIGRVDKDDLRLIQKGQGEVFFREEIQEPHDFESISEVLPKRETRKQGTKPAQNIMARAYNQILGELQKAATHDGRLSEEELIDVVNQYLETLLSHFFIIEISASNQENAFQIFQRLNARGKDLTSADLIKSNFFGAAKSEDQAERIKNCWQNAQTNLQTEDITDYVRYLWNSQSGFSTKRNLYRKVIQEKKSIRDILAFTSDIDQYSSIFAQISNIKAAESELYDILGASGVSIIWDLNALKFHAYYPLVLALLKRKTTVEENIKVMSVVRQILVRNKIMNGGTNWLEKLMSAVAVDIVKTRGQTTIDQAIEKLDAKMTEHGLDDQSIADVLKRFDFSKDEALAKSLLRMVENNEFNGKERGSVLPGNSEIHLEHIMPRTPKALDDWGTFSDEEERQKYLWQIGNLSLWYGPDNSALKNASFDIKKAGEPGKHNGYKDSTISLTQKLTEYSVWNRENIAKRGEQIIQLILAL